MEKYGVYGVLWIIISIVVLVMSYRKLRKQRPEALQMSPQKFVMTNLYDLLLGGWSFLWIVFFLLGILYIGKPLYWW